MTATAVKNPENFSQCGYAGTDRAVYRWADADSRIEGLPIPGSGSLWRWRPALGSRFRPRPTRRSEPPKYEVRKDHDPNGIGKFYMGREIAQVMGYQAAGWLERPEREKEEEPAKLVEALEREARHGGRRRRGRQRLPRVPAWPRSSATKGKVHRRRTSSRRCST